MNPTKFIAAISLLFVAKLSQTTAQDELSVDVTNGDDYDTSIFTNEFDSQYEEQIDSEQFEAEFSKHDFENSDINTYLDHNGAHGRLLNHQASDVPEDYDDRRHLDHHGSHGRRLMIIGPDNRVQYNPYDKQRGVGLLQTSTKNCTATLIGREYIVTAASCVYEDSVVKKKKVRSIPADLYTTAVFHFGLDNGAPSKFNSGLRKVYADAAYVKMKSNAEQMNVAVISLKEAIGQVTHSMKATVVKPVSKYKNLGVNAIGFFFDGNTTAGADYCCKIIGSHNAGQVKHLCDIATYGGIGAPLFQQIVKSGINGEKEISYALVAVHNGEAPTKGYNIATKSQVVDRLFKVARKNNIPIAPKYNGTAWDTMQSEIVCTATPTAKPTPRPTKYPTEPTLSPTIPTNSPTDPTASPTPQTNSPTTQTNSPTPLTKSPTPPTNSPTPPTNSPTPQTNSPTPQTNSPTPLTNSPTPQTNSPTPPTNSPTTPTNSPTPLTNSPTPPTNSPTPLTKSPTPPTNSPTPPTNSPTPPTNSPTPPTNSPTLQTNSPTHQTNSPTIQTNSPTPPTKSPTPPTNSPTPPTNSPTPPTKSPTTPTNSPTPPTNSPTPPTNSPTPPTKSPTTPTNSPTTPTKSPTTPTNSPTPPTNSPTPPTKSPTTPTKSPTTPTKSPTTPTNSPSLPDCPEGKTRCNDHSSPHFGDCIDPTPSPTAFPTAYPTAPTWHWGRRTEEAIRDVTIEVVSAETKPRKKLRA